MKRTTLVHELEKAATELDCHCSAPKLCSRDRVAARLRARAAYVRKLRNELPSLADRELFDALTGPDIEPAPTTNGGTDHE